MVPPLVGVFVDAIHTEHTARISVAVEAGRVAEVRVPEERGILGSRGMVALRIVLGHPNNDGRRVPIKPSFVKKGQIWVSSPTMWSGFQTFGTNLVGAPPESLIFQHLWQRAVRWCIGPPGCADHFADRRAGFNDLWYAVPVLKFPTHSGRSFVTR